MRAETVAALRDAVGTDLAAFGDLLADDVQWYGPYAGGGCRNREDVLRTIEAQVEDGAEPLLIELREVGDRLLLEVGIGHGERRSVTFYGLLGFTVIDSFEHQGERVWVWLESEDARLMLARGDGPAKAEAVLFYLYSHDLAALRDHLVANGVTPGEIVDGSPGPREEMRVTDPDGYYLMIAQITDDTG